MIRAIVSSPVGLGRSSLEELEHYVKTGVLIAIGSRETGIDGKQHPAYREKRPLFDAVLEELEAAGLVARNGRFRRGRDGKLHPVYVLRDGSPGTVWVPGLTGFHGGRLNG